MAGITLGSFDRPDETRRPEKTKIAVVRPVVGTDPCQARHVGAILSGRLHVVHTDGSEGEAGPGDAYTIEPGLDAWAVGDE